jgi:hypothetical protein
MEDKNIYLEPVATHQIFNNQIIYPFCKNFAREIYIEDSTYNITFSLDEWESYFKQD